MSDDESAGASVTAANADLQKTYDVKSGSQPIKQGEAFAFMWGQPSYVIKDPPSMLEGGEVFMNKDETEITSGTQFTVRTTSSASLYLLIEDGERDGGLPASIQWLNFVDTTQKIKWNKAAGGGSATSEHNVMGMCVMLLL